MALVIISSTVAAKNVHPGWRQLAVPLLTWENDLLDDLAMTGKRSGADYGEAEKERYLWLVNAPHPPSAGLPAGAANVYVKQAPMSWGQPGLGAATIATLYGQPEKAATKKARRWTAKPWPRPGASCSFWTTPASPTSPNPACACSTRPWTGRLENVQVIRRHKRHGIKAPPKHWIAERSLAWLSKDAALGDASVDAFVKITSFRRLA